MAKYWHFSYKKALITNCTIKRPTKKQRWENKKGGEESDSLLLEREQVLSFIGRQCKRWRQKLENIHTLNFLTFQLLFPVRQEDGVTLLRKWRGHTVRPLALHLCKHDCIAKAFSLSLTFRRIKLKHTSYLLQNSLFQHNILHLFQKLNIMKGKRLNEWVVPLHIQFKRLSESLLLLDDIVHVESLWLMTGIT